MDNLYFYLIILLAILAIGDLIVGVSNDAVNFLNSAIGSKAISFKTIMILASIGVVLGSVFSSGMMEVARKGIFNPNVFYFDEIMYIFMAVMVTDILLLDFFNALGMPTSTTVSIVFELLGAAIVMAIIKINISGDSLITLGNYINTSKATQIILGILLSVFFAFTIGAFVQWISRFSMGFFTDSNPTWKQALFGSFSLTAMTNFILIKGLKGTLFAHETSDFLGGDSLYLFLEKNSFSANTLILVFWFVISFVVIRFLKVSIFKLIIGLGTFSLALAFAGNDLVNFIGVPMAAFQSYKAWVASGVAASEYKMTILAGKVHTPSFLLFSSGIIMMLTLWFSSKSKKVVETSINLSSQNLTKERFKSNSFSKAIVRGFTLINEGIVRVIPKKVQDKIAQKFNETSKINFALEKDAPSFDLVRASINLVVAALLISVATSFKLPLSTTYVTFMVSMGTSLADRAWGKESAVYRVAGVINVIGGWFFTAISAFLISGIILYLLYLGEEISISIVVLFVLVILGKNLFESKKEGKKTLEEKKVLKAESRSVQGVISESSENISNVIQNTNKIYTLVVAGLSTNNLKTLKKGKEKVKKLSKNIIELREDVFYFIKNLEDPTLSASNFYISLLSDIHTISEDLNYLVKISYDHIDNNHSKLKMSQIRDLLNIHKSMELVLTLSIQTPFDKDVHHDQLEEIIKKKEELYDILDKKINNQISRTKELETSPKNTTLYFNILLKSKDLLEHKLNLIERLYKTSKAVNP